MQCYTPRLKGGKLIGATPPTQTFYNQDVGEAVVPFEDAILTQPEANGSTTSLNVLETIVRGSGQISFRNSLDAVTLASAQVAYRHYETSPNNPDDFRRGLAGESPYPAMIRFGNYNTGIISEAVSDVNTGIIAYELVPDAPEGMMVYRPLVRNSSNFSNLAPILFVFRGTDSLWDIMRTLALNNNVFVPALYESKLLEFKDYITNYGRESTTQNYSLIGQYLGANFALDLTYELLKHNVEVMRLDGVYIFNGFYPVDDRWQQIYTAMSNKRSGDDHDRINTELVRSQLRTHLKSYIIKGDFASQ